MMQLVKYYVTLSDEEPHNQLTLENKGQILYRTEKIATLQGWEGASILDMRGRELIKPIAFKLTLLREEEG